MPMQPEIFGSLVGSLLNLLNGKQCIRSECGFVWAALFFRGMDKALFFCWRGLLSGLCLATEEQVSGLVRTENGVPPFSEALRKHIVRSSLEGIEQIGQDRVIGLDFSRLLGAGIARKRTLVFEIAGKRRGLLLLDEVGNIIETSRQKRDQAGLSSEVRPGYPYSLPDRLHEPPLSSTEGPDLLYSLDYIAGIGKKLGSDILRNWHLYSLKSWSNMVTGIKDTESPMTERRGFRLQVIKKDLSIFPVPLGNNPLMTGALPEVLEKFTIQPLSGERLLNIRSNLLRDSEAMKRRLSSMREGLKSQVELSKDAWKHKAAGELLLANYGKISRGSDAVTLPFWDGDHYRDLVIRIDPALTISQNAQYYFRKFKKQSSPKAGIDEAMQAIIERESELADFAERVQETNDLFGLASLKEVFRGIGTTPDTAKGHGNIKQCEFMGYRIISGSNRKANRRVTFVIASQEDIWFHARGVPGGHVIIKTNRGETPVMTVLQFAASMAASLSRSSEALKVDVDYTKRKHVKSIPGTIAEVTYSNARTIRVSPSLWRELQKGI